MYALARDRLVAERHWHRPLAITIPEAREAPDGESDDHRRLAMVRKADLKFLDRIRREVQVDVAATNVVTWASNLERVRAGEAALGDRTSDDLLPL